MARALAPLPPRGPRPRDSPGSTPPPRPCSATRLLFFSAATEGVGRDLWMTDGTATGTVLVKDLHPGGGGSIGLGSTFFSLPAQGLVVFSATDDPPTWSCREPMGPPEAPCACRISRPAPAPRPPSTSSSSAIRSSSRPTMGDTGRELWVAKLSTSDGHHPTSTPGAVRPRAEHGLRLHLAPRGNRGALGLGAPRRPHPSPPAVRMRNAVA